MTIRVTLTGRDETFVAEKLKTGAFQSPEEMLRQGLQLLAQDDARQRKIACLQAEVEKGFTGPSSPWTEIDSNRLRALVCHR